jgi:uncharacterized protein YigA (DUF484 family)
MSGTQSQEFSANVIDEQNVVRFLRTHPDLLLRHPDLLAQLRIPHVEAGNAISLVERQVQRLRQDNAQQAKRLAELLDIARSNDRLSDLSHRLLLILLDARNDASALLERLATQLYQDFAADSVAIRLNAAPRDAGFAGREEWVQEHQVFNELFGKFLRQGAVQCGRLTQTQRDYLFGDGAAQIASVALLPLRENARALGLIAIGSHDAARFHSGMGTVFLERMAAITAKLLAPHLDPH